jgi:putative transcriptional regulator
MGHLPVKPFGPLKRFRYQLMKNNLHVERAIKKMTQADVADKVGVSRQTINSIESNKYIPSTLLALKIARVFGKSVEDIFQLEKKDL